MSKERVLETILCWTDAAGEDRETCVDVTYTVEPAFAGDWDEPGYDATAEILDVKVTSGDPLPGDWEAEKDLLAECVAHDQEWRMCERDAAAEDRADYLRERAMWDDAL